jgi:hypothetical protein
VAADERWTVSCSENGKVIYRQAIDVPVADFDTSSVTARYPDAACVFLAPADPVPQLPPGAAGDLDAALRAISGNAPSGVPQTLPIIPAEIPPAPDLGLVPELAPSTVPELPPIVSPPRFRPDSPDWVRLATYRTEDVGDALSDWAAIAGAEMAFRRMVPSLNRTDDGYITLSAGPVPEGERDGICIAASAQGLDCVWGTGEEPVPAGAPDLASRYLAHLFPDHVLPPRDWQQCPRRDALSPQVETPPDRELGYTCWSSPFAMPTVFPSYQPGLAGTDTGMPPLPRPRPDRGQ